MAEENILRNEIRNLNIPGTLVEYQWRLKLDQSGSKWNFIMSDKTRIWNHKDEQIIGHFDDHAISKFWISLKRSLEK